MIRPSDKLIVLGRKLLNSPAEWQELGRFNGLQLPFRLTPGSTLRIPLRLIGSTPARGRLVSVNGDVQLLGAPAAAGTAVAEGGRLQTGANSSAVLELADGSRVTLLPNTLAELVTSRGYATRDAAASGSAIWFAGLVRLVQGGLDTAASKTAQRAQPLQIQTPTSLVGVRGTQFRVAFDDPASDSYRTEVVEGTVRADNPAQQSGADLPKGTGAVVRPAEKEVKVVALLPAPDLAGVPGMVLKPDGGWLMPVLTGAQAYRVQLASDEKFEKITRDLKVTSPSVDLTSLANGTWFARVRGIDKQGLEGFDSFKRLLVKNAEWRVSYASLSIANGQSELIWTAQQTDGQPFSGTAYGATLARNAAFTQGVTTAQGADARLILGDLQPGVYFFRLRATLASGGSLDSMVYRFEIPAGWGQTVNVLNSPLVAVN